jgi:hypothetical protein
MRLQTDERFDLQLFKPCCLEVPDELPGHAQRSEP